MPRSSPPTGDWRRSLLRLIGAPVTPANLRLLKTWQRWEGGHTKNLARFNWLNTTINAPGAVNSINSVGVKAFDSFQSGVNALASTLLNGRYDDVVQGLRGGDPYKGDISAGLSTWVSGSPTGNLSYAQKVLGRPLVARSATPYASSSSPRSTHAPQGPDLDPLKVAFEDDPEFVSLLKLIDGMPEPEAVPGPELEGPPPAGGPALVLPTQWRGTHVTSGLGWGTRSAADIMAEAGTPVGAPENGVVMRWNPTGAQGGGSMYFRSTTGRLYWIGHVADGLPPGTRVRRGQRLAIVSPDHPRPHVHLDAQ